MLYMILLLILAVLVCVGLSLVLIYIYSPKRAKAQLEYKYETVSQLKDQLQLQTLLANSTDKQQAAIAAAINATYNITTVTADTVAPLVEGMQQANNSAINNTQSRLKPML